MTVETDAYALSAEQIVHRYGERTALDAFSLTIPRGVTFGVLGPNGSGKSTFLSLAAATEQPQQGSLRILGRTPAPELRARIGTVFQENAQDPLMRVDEHLALAGRLFGVQRSEIRERTATLLATFGLAERQRDPIASLSGGMRRRLEVVRALLHKPELLLLDEPTTGVDPDERAALWDAISASGERTVVLATNDLAEADAVCDLVAFVRDGRVLTIGAPDDLKRGLRRESVRLTWPGVHPDQLATISGLRGVGTVAADGSRVVATVDDASPFVAEVFHIAPGEIRAVEIEAASLEDAYFQYVGQRERAGDGS